MNVAVVGIWHLGLITSVCLPKIGHKITAFDEKKIIGDLKDLNPPVDEPKVKKFLKDSYKKRLFFESNFKNLNSYSLIWITYDSNIDKNDISDSQSVLKKIKKVINYAKKNATVIISTQLPLGSLRKLENYIYKINRKNELIYIPENLRLGNSVKLFLNPDRLIVGSRDIKKIKPIVQKLLKNIKCEKIFVSPETAEMTKHVINSYLACSVSFINEIGNISKKFDIPFDELEVCVKSDGRIGKKAYLKIGNPFSGGTLARDLNFINQLAKKYNSNRTLIKSIIKSNLIHSNWIINTFNKLNKNNQNKKVLIFGLGYKDKSSTIRRSLSYDIFEKLKNKYLTKIKDDFIFKNSSEVNKIKHYFITEDSEEKFDYVILFKKMNKIRDVSNSLYKKSIIIDVSGENKFFKNKKNKYVSIENV